VALTLEAEVNAFLASLDDEQQRDYDRLALACPFGARGAEVMVVPDRSFRRAGDLVALLGSPSMGAVEREGFEVPGRTPGTDRIDGLNGRLPTQRPGPVAREWVRVYLNGARGQFGYPSYDGYRTNADSHRLCDAPTKSVSRRRCSRCPGGPGRSSWLSPAPSKRT